MKKVVCILTTIMLLILNTLPAYGAEYMVNPFYAIESYKEYERIQESLGVSDHIYYGWSRIARDSKGSMVFTSSRSAISKDDFAPEYNLPMSIEGKLTNEIHKATHPGSKNLLMVFFSKVPYENGENSATKFLNMSSTDWEQNIIAPMVSMLNSYSFDGVVLDFEGFTDSNLKLKYNSFLEQLKSRLPGKELVVCVNVPGNYGGYDYEYIYNIADYTILLSYPYQHYSKYAETDGIPELVGRIREVDVPEAQPYEKVRLELDKLVNSLSQKYGRSFNPKKILLGTTLEISGWVQRELIYNGKTYTYYESTRSLPSSSRFHVKSLDGLQQINGTIEYVDASRIYKYGSKTYKKTVDKDLEPGMKKIEYYYETSESIYDKCYSLVNEYNLGGISIWRIGLGDYNTWSSIRNVFTLPDGGYEELPSKTDVPSDKVWTVKFNMAVDSTSVLSSRDSITVVDSIGNPQAVRFEYDDAANSVKVYPIGSYEPGQVYYLIIGKAIKSRSNNSMYLGKPVRMKFKIKG